MSQLSPAQPRAQSSPTQPYSPALQAVLSSLDVQLEEELARYRRQRPAKTVPPRAGARPQSQKTLDLISVRATGGRTQPQTAPVTVPESLPAIITNRNVAPGEAETENRQLDLPNATLATPDLSIDDNQIAHLEHFPGLARTDGGSIDTAASGIQPNEYLQSSPAQLKELAQEKAAAQAERSFGDSLLSPLGIGSMLLLLLSSATLGYIAMNPSSLSHLPLGRLFASKTATVAKNPQKTPAAGEDKAGENSIPNSPNLASQEFVELNLRSLSTLKPKNTPKAPPLPTIATQVPVNAPAPLPRPVGSPVPLDLPAALLPPSVQSGVLPQIGDRPPAPLPAPAGTNRQRSVPKQQAAASKPIQGTARFAPAGAPNGGQAAASKQPPAKAKAASAKDNKFLVVTAYSGSSSLAQVRKVTPDAYVRRLPQGSRIQVASFPSESEAQKKVRDLRKQGISAQIYRR